MVLLMRWQSTIIAALIGCLTTGGLNLLGWLAVSERKLYDYYLRSRPLEAPDKKIVIVGLGEADLEKYGFPISDDTLATLLTKVKEQKPRVIGLNLHRNVSIGEFGHKRLNHLFRSTPELIGVEKTDGGNSDHSFISPPSELAKLDQTGASEIIEDSQNGVVRRGYLYVQKSTEKEIIPSLGLATALKYLENEDIFPKSHDSKSWLKLRNAVFPMFEENRLFYSEQSIDNYQTTINYINNKNDFVQISASEVLKNEVKEDFFQDKIVFIGTMAETIEDVYLTPYSYNHQGDYNFVYGVEIHASISSQIINAALNGRIIIKTIPFLWQCSYLLILLIITSFSSWYVSTFLKQKRTIIRFICLVLYLIAILLLGNLLLFLGWWFSTVTALSLIFSTEVCIYVFAQFSQLKQQNLILEARVKERTKDLEKAQKKILSQEKLVLHQKLAQYLSHEIKNKTNIIGLNIENSQADLKILELIIEDNSFIFEDAIDDYEESPQSIITNLNNKLFRINSINQKVTSIINQIYNQSANNSYLDPSIETELDFHQFLDNCLIDIDQLCQTNFNNLQIEIRRNYDSSLKKRKCRLIEVERALDNIIYNAIYHLYLKKQNIQNFQPILSISTQKKPNSIEIKIRDNGTGIARENLELIFQMFWTTKTSGKGFGLGLYFTKELIKKCGGKVSVNSIEGEYTEFTVTLP